MATPTRISMMMMSRCLLRNVNYRHRISLVKPDKYLIQPCFRNLQTQTVASPRRKRRIFLWILTIPIGVGVGLYVVDKALFDEEVSLQRKGNHQWGSRRETQQDNLRHLSTITGLNE